MISDQGRRVIYQRWINIVVLTENYRCTTSVPLFYLISTPIIFNVLQSNGMDAITGLSNYITNIDIWFKNFSDNSYTLCYIRSEQVQPIQASFWLVGQVVNHSLDSAQPYDCWMLSIHLPPTAINALVTHLEPGPFKPRHFDSTWNTNVFCSQRQGHFEIGRGGIRGRCERHYTNGSALSIHIWRVHARSYWELGFLYPYPVMN